MWLGLYLGRTSDPKHHADVLAVAAPLWFVLVTMLHSAVHVALRPEADRADLDREWLAHISATKLRPALLWAGFAACCLILPRALPWAVEASYAALGAGPVGAWLHLVGGGLALLAMAYAVRPRSEALGTALALLGLLSTAMTVFFAVGITSFLGEGGTERGSAYPVPIGLALAGAGLWWLSRRPQAEPRPSRRELRAQERAERAERARERDAALESAAGPPRPRPWSRRLCSWV